MCSVGTLKRWKHIWKYCCFSWVLRRTISLIFAFVDMVSNSVHKPLPYKTTLYRRYCGNDLTRREPSYLLLLCHKLVYYYHLRPRSLPHLKWYPNQRFNDSNRISHFLLFNHIFPPSASVLGPDWRRRFGQLIWNLIVFSFVKLQGCLF